MGFYDWFPIYSITILLVVAFGGSLLQIILTLINLSGFRIYTEDGYLYKVTKFKKRKMRISDIKSVGLSDISQRPYKAILSLEEYMYVGYAYFGSPTVAVKISGVSNKSVLLTEPMLRFPRTVSVIKTILENNSAIKIDNFIRTLLDKGTYNRTMLHTTTQGRHAIGKNYLIILLSFIIGFTLIFALLTLILNNIS